MTPKGRDKQLNEMFDKVRPENKHAETDCGPPFAKSSAHASQDVSRGRFGLLMILIKRRQASSMHSRTVTRMSVEFTNGAIKRLCPRKIM